MYNLVLIPLVLTASPPHSAPPDSLVALAHAYMQARALRPRAGAYTHLIPSFSRQTGLPCSACHTAFPALTPFGRQFKLNGYTLTGMQTVTAGDSGKRASLQLGLIPPVSAMALASWTETKTTQPGTQNGTVQLPQQLSLFVGGAITPKLGTFVQVTYDPEAGGIGIDNVDVRFATRTTLASKDVLFGISLNNSPTVQDVWNSTPAWGFPFAASSVAPAPVATLVEGGLAQNVAGLGAYSLWANTIYTELSVYRSAPQGSASLLDSMSTNTVKGVAPYGRLALQHQWGPNYMMVGGYGLVTNVYPTGVGGLRDRYRDLALDAQYERPLGGGNVSAHARWIDEQQTLDATFAGAGSANPSNTLKTFRVDGQYYTAARVGGAIGYFTTRGSADPILYAAAPVSGSATGRPNSDGVLFELNYMPWLNTRLTMQYVTYSKYNGASRDYDGAGRNASDNNTLYLMTWFAF